MISGIIDSNQKIVTNGLIMHLDAAQLRSYPGSGTTWTDLSQNSNNGTLINGPTFSSLNGGLIVYDGVNDYVRSTTAALPSGTSLFTLSLWINIVNITGNFAGKGLCIFSGNQFGTIEAFLLPEISNVPGPPYSFFLSRYGGGTTGTCNFVLPIPMPLMTWHNLVIIRDGSASQKIYLNGSLIGNGNVSNSFTSAMLHIGAAPAATDFSGLLNGSISNVLRYNRALSETEVVQNYNATKSRFGL